MAGEEAYKEQAWLVPSLNYYCNVLATSLGTRLSSVEEEEGSCARVW